MFLLIKPSAEFVREYLSAQQSGQFSYPDVGASRKSAPAGYTVDHNRMQLGTGAGTFERAVHAVNAWKVFDIPWLELYPPKAPVQVGTTVAVLVRHLQFWSLNSCRIVYVMEERGVREIYGFAYGTLTDHAKMGEERFFVQFDSVDQSVWYDIYAFSRPRPLVRAAFPLARMLQRRFARGSMTAMLRAVQDDLNFQAQH
jgi:uncharacterized protein (UPF0548 family)